MADKLVNIDYKKVNTNVSISNVYANVDSDTTYKTRVDISTLGVSNTLYDNSINVVVKGVDETSIPTTGKFRRAVELLSIGSFAEKTYIKNTPIENIGLSDQFDSKIEFNRPILDFVFSSTLTKAYLDKVLLDISNIAEVYVNSVYKQEVSNIYSADKSTAFIDKIALDSASIQEYKTSIILKNTADSINYSDQFYTITNYNRDLQDFIDATDDYYGLANIDDDQYAYFDKRLVSTYYTIDTSYKLSTKIFADNFHKQDVVKLLISIKEFDSFSTSTKYTFRTIKRPRDNVYRSDVVSKYALKSLVENPTKLSDSKINVNVGKFVTDIYSTYITVNSSVIKPTSDYLSISEYIYSALSIPRSIDTSILVTELSSADLYSIKEDAYTASLIEYLYITIPKQTTFNSIDSYTTVSNFYRDILDTVYSTDDYYGLANIDDDQTAIFGKNLVDVIYSTEFNILSVEKVSLETVDSSITVEKEISVPFSNLFIGSDTNNNDTTKPLSDTIYNSDFYSLYLNTYIGYELVDYDIASTELSSALVDKTLLDYSTTLELASFFKNKVALDSIVLDDPKLFDVYKTLVTLTSTYTDNFSDVSTVRSDSTDQILDSTSLEGLVGLITSTNSIQDIIDILSYISYSIASMINLSDSGYANNQNYFSEAYVEPGYVGTNTYFS